MADHRQICMTFMLMLTLCSVSVLYMEELASGMVARAETQRDMMVSNGMLVESWAAADRIQQSRLDIAEDMETMEVSMKTADAEITALEVKVEDYIDIIEHKDGLLSDKDVLTAPAYVEVARFLKEDRTDSLEWTRDHDCTQFANALIRNARDKGIHACFVEINFDCGGGHAIVAIRTSDHGVLYFEPQTDRNVHMYKDMDYGTYMGYSDDVSLIVSQYDSCYGRVH